MLCDKVTSHPILSPAAPSGANYSFGFIVGRHGTVELDEGESVGADGGLLVGRRDMDGTNDGIVLGCNDGLLESS